MNFIVVFSRDRFGVIRDEFGPFWPKDYGPLHPTPVHERLAGQKGSQPEPLLTPASVNQASNNSRNVSADMLTAWHSAVVVYDADKSNRECMPTNGASTIANLNSEQRQRELAPPLWFESRFECGNLRQARRVCVFSPFLAYNSIYWSRNLAAINILFGLARAHNSVWIFFKIFHPIFVADVSAEICGTLILILCFFSWAFFGEFFWYVFSGERTYELVLNTDLNTARHTQWYYFRVRNAVPHVAYRFIIVNFMKPTSLYNEGNYS